MALPYTVLTDKYMASTNTNFPAVHCVAIDKALRQALYSDRQQDERNSVRYLGQRKYNKIGMD